LIALDRDDSRNDLHATARYDSARATRVHIHAISFVTVSLEYCCVMNPGHAHRHVPRFVSRHSPLAIRPAPVAIRPALVAIRRHSRYIACPIAARHRPALDDVARRRRAGMAIAPSTVRGAALALSAACP